MSDPYWYRRYRHFVRVLLNIKEARAAQRQLGHPERGLRIVGVTGTDGKTTTVTLLTAILRADGRQAGMVSTVGAEINGELIDTGLHVSTPGPGEVYDLLARMRQEGVTDVVLEVTAHALDQRRIFGVPVAVGVVTNIAPEHLDYFNTFEKYVAAKSMLVRQAQVTVLNEEDGSTPKLVRMARRAARYGIRNQESGMRNEVDVWAEEVGVTADGSRFAICAVNGERSTVNLPLPGRYNVLNALAAATAALELGVSMDAIGHGLESVNGVAGRWEVMQEQPFSVIVDFAHTPQAFEEVLPLARLATGAGGRVIHVFGSAAGRDEEKRSVMGEISGKLADMTVLTMEDPRFESLDRVDGMIAEGLKRTGKHENEGWRRIDDRAEAIEWAISQAKPGDVVLITGKGHEKSLAVQGKELPWSDQEAVRKALEKQ